MMGTQVFKRHFENFTKGLPQNEHFHRGCVRT